jgi:hypothetical protein
MYGSKRRVKWKWKIKMRGRQVQKLRAGAKNGVGWTVTIIESEY